MNNEVTEDKKKKWKNVFLDVWYIIYHLRIKKKKIWHQLRELPNLEYCYTKWQIVPSKSEGQKRYYNTNWKKNLLEGGTAMRQRRFWPEVWPFAWASVEETNIHWVQGAANIEYFIPVILLFFLLLKSTNIFYLISVEVQSNQLVFGTSC